MELLNHVAVLNYHRTGSSYTCDPPVTDTDQDWVVLLKEEHKKDFSLYLIRAGYDYDDYKAYENLSGDHEFVSWKQLDYFGRKRQDGINLIVTTNPDWYELFVEATEIAKEENLLKKEDRVACFEMIMRRYRKAKPSNQTTWEPKTLNELSQITAMNATLANQLFRTQYVYETALFPSVHLLQTLNNFW